MGKVSVLVGSDAVVDGAVKDSDDGRGLLPGYSGLDKSVDVDVKAGKCGVPASSVHDCKGVARWAAGKTTK